MFLRIASNTMLLRS